MTRTSEQLMWRTATPLWDAEVVDPDALRRPALLGMAGDDFMTDLVDALADVEARFDELVAGNETWRDATSPADRIGVLDPEDEPAPDRLKLYQPVHDRFYLAAANLVCRRPGLPDHRLRGQERASMVIRQRRRIGDRDVELAWTGTRWVALDGPLPIPTEERLPLAPTVHERDGRRRRLLTAVIPIGARERYEGATALAAPETDPDDPLTDHRLARLIETIIDPLHRLWQGAVAPQPDDEPIEESFVFSVVELSDLLRRLLDLGAIAAPGPAPALSATAQAVRDHLDGAAYRAGGTTWLDAIRQAEVDRRSILLDGELPASLRLTHLELADAIEAVATTAGGAPPDDHRTWDLYRLVRDHTVANPVPPEAGPALPPAPETSRRYVIRCVYEREGCPIRPEWVSEPSAPFEMAGFFDPDAPTRDHRIALPFDTSPAGLRKFPRNVSMVLSNELRKQMARIDGIKMEDLDGGELKDEGRFDLGMVCSLSIPIITIAALILLMIIVSLLNIVFWWIPLFKVCLPVGRQS